MKFLIVTLMWTTNKTQRCHLDKVATCEDWSFLGFLGRLQVFQMQPQNLTEGIKSVICLQENVILVNGYYCILPANEIHYLAVC